MALFFLLQAISVCAAVPGFHTDTNTWRRWSAVVGEAGEDTGIAPNTAASFNRGRRLSSFGFTSDCDCPHMDVEVDSSPTQSQLQLKLECGDPSVLQLDEEYRDICEYLRNYLSHAYSPLKKDATSTVDQNHNRRILNFFVIGDYGGEKKAAETTAPLLQALRTMGNYLSAPSNSEWPTNGIWPGILSLGDNFYKPLPARNRQLREEQINAVFRTPFADGFTFADVPNIANKLPMFGVLGNHDHYEASHYKYQLQLSKDEYLNKQDKKYPQWFIPHLWYTLQMNLSDKKRILFIFYDTSILVGHHTTGNRYTEKQLRDKQIAWLHNLQIDEKVVFIFFIVHHPPFSTAQHNGNDAVIEMIATFITKNPKFRGKVCVFGGHDHNFQAGIIPPTTKFTDFEPHFLSLRGLRSFVIGGSRYCDPHSWKRDNIAQPLERWKRQFVDAGKRYQLHQLYATNMIDHCTQDTKGGFAHLRIIDRDDSTTIISVRIIDEDGGFTIKDKINEGTKDLFYWHVINDKFKNSVFREEPGFMS